MRMRAADDVRMRLAPGEYAEKFSVVMGHGASACCDLGWWLVLLAAADPAGAGDGRVNVPADRARPSGDSVDELGHDGLIRSLAAVPATRLGPVNQEQGAKLQVRGAPH